MDAREWEDEEEARVQRCLISWYRFYWSVISELSPVSLMVRFHRDSNRWNRTIPVQTRAYNDNSVKFYRLRTSQLSLNLIILQFWMIKIRTWQQVPSNSERVFSLPPPLNWIFFISGSVLSIVFTLTHCVNSSSSRVSVYFLYCCPIKLLFTSTSLTNTSMSVSESFASSSHRFMPWLCHDSPWKPTLIWLVLS